MKATTIHDLRSGQIYPALQDSRGRKVTATFTTFDEDRALKYAELAAELSPHDDVNSVTWPKVKTNLI